MNKKIEATLLGFAIILVFVALLFEVGCHNKEPYAIRVEVVNASGVDSLTQNVVEFLRNNNFDVVLIRNDRENIVEKSQVIDRIDNLEYANEVANALGISKENVRKEIDEKLLVDITVAIGKDYQNLIVGNIL